MSEFPDITTDDGSIWRYVFTASNDIKDYWDDMERYQVADMLFGNTLLVYNKKEVKVYVPKSLKIKK